MSNPIVTVVAHPVARTTSWLPFPFIHLRQAMRSALALGLLTGASLVHGQAIDVPDNPGFPDHEAPWEEKEMTALPPAPQDADLIEFYVSPTATFKFALDRKSLAIDHDGVVRFTLVATSPRGARNVSYEGIRCLTRERKLYAYGRTDGSWLPARRVEWAHITEATTHRQYAALYKEILCDAGHPVADIDAMVRRMGVRTLDTP